MHPYEVDATELDFVKEHYGPLPLKWRVTQFVGRSGVPGKLRKLVHDYDMMSFKQAYYSKDGRSPAQAESEQLSTSGFTELTA